MSAKAEAEGLEAEIAKVCGVINAATARLVDLIARVLGTQAWEGAGIRSPEQWVVEVRGVVGAGPAPGGHGQAVDGAAPGAGWLRGRRVERGAGGGGVPPRPAATDAQMSEFARFATVGQLRRTLSAYSFAGTPAAEPAAAEPERRCDFGYTDEGAWRLSALLAPDEGAVVERALAAARDELFHAGQHDPGPRPTAAGAVSWADALVAMADRSLGGASRAQGDRYTVLLHVPVAGEGDAGGHVHLGPGLGQGLSRYLACDARVRAVFEEAGRPVSVSRSWRTVPDRTRAVVEDRDRGCRVPGCERRRWLHVHHITHWEDGGPTDTANLLALCSRHHRLHHVGRLGIRGNADDPDGVVFTDQRGRVLAPAGRPSPPVGPLPAPSRTWVHPTGERLERKWVHFREPKAPSGQLTAGRGQR